MHRGRRGFTLIELLVVIAIIAILAAILFPVFASAKVAAKRASCADNLKQLGYAIEVYKQDFSGYPASTRYGGADTPWGFANWVYRVKPYTKNLYVFNCPGAAQPYQIVYGYPKVIIKVGYAYNQYVGYMNTATTAATPWDFHTEHTIRRPSQVLLMADGYRYALTNDWNDDNEGDKRDSLPCGMNRVRYAEGYEDATKEGRARHDGPNILFCDLHVQNIKAEQFKAEGWPGCLAANQSTCREWPVIYPKARAYK